MTKKIHHHENFKRALRRLEEAVGDAESDLEIDGVIQRFEFTFELFWKMLKSHLERDGILCQSPRACLKEAYLPIWIQAFAAAGRTIPRSRKS